VSTNRLAEYDAVARLVETGLGDWIFAVPPFRHASETADAEYLAFLRSFDLPDELMQAALAMRRLAPAFLEHMADEVRAIGPQVVGFSSTFNQHVPSLVLAKILKAHDPALSVVFGGANGDGPMGAALHRAFPWVDVVVRGEAGRILPDLVRDLAVPLPPSTSTSTGWRRRASRKSFGRSSPSPTRPRAGAGGARNPIARSAASMVTD
jgi:hypothetical protein